MLIKVTHAQVKFKIKKLKVWIKSKIYKSNTKNNKYINKKNIIKLNANINTAEEFAAKASKDAPSIESFYLSQEDEIIGNFVKNAPAIKEALDVHPIKCDYNLENVCFLEFYYL